VAGAATAGSVRDALGGAADALRAAGVESPRLDAELLLAEATGWDRARLGADPEAGVPAAPARRFAETVRRRLRREPVAYILGHKGFRWIDLAVDRRVLIPRPETELLVELALELRPHSVLDVGTGSGAVALAIADELPGCEVTATDSSADALEVARANAERLGLTERVRFFEGTIPGDPGEASDGSGGPGTPESAPDTPGSAPDTFELIVANLPYVAESDWDSLQPEVTKWEPREALLAGPDGLDAIRSVLPECVRCLCRSAPGKANAPGVLALEVGEGQAEAVAGLLREAGFGEVETRPDLAGIPRVVVGRSG
jgi:release factor glutamine methyltransferase